MGVARTVVLVLRLQSINKCNTWPWQLALVEQRVWTKLWLNNISIAVLSYMPCIKALLSSLQTIVLKGRAGDLFDLFLECNLRHAAEGRQFATTEVAQVSRKSILVCCYSCIHHTSWSNTVPTETGSENLWASRAEHSLLLVEPGCIGSPLSTKNKRIQFFL